MFTGSALLRRRLSVDRRGWPASGCKIEVDGLARTLYTRHRSDAPKKDMTLKEARKSFPTNKVLAEAYRNLWPLMQRGVSESEYFILWRKEVGRLRDRNQRWSDRERAKHPERYRAFARASYHRHRQRRVEDARRVRQERKNDPERLLAHRIWCRNNVKRRKAIDPQYRIRFLMRNRIWMALDRGVAK